MEQTWRWFGPNDPIQLKHIAEAGATGIVTALHHIPVGRPWRDEAVAERREAINAAGLAWSVVESIPVTNAIKVRDSRWRSDVDAWKQSLRAVGKAGIRTVCYNFMPIVDWTRTDLRYALGSGLALRFDLIDFVACDAFIMRRTGAEGDYDQSTVDAAQARFEEMSASRRTDLERIVLAGLPGSDVSYDRTTFLDLHRQYSGMTANDLRSSLADFLREVVPVAEELGIRLAIHPDDPPTSLFGLPRVVSTAADAAALLTAVDSPANGLTLCVGSYASRDDNDVIEMMRRFGPRTHFLHLRNVVRQDPGSFYEAGHVDGDIDMVGVIAAALAEEQRRIRENRTDVNIPFRPDHGHLLAADPVRNANPGYSYIGRLKGLAELRGVVAGLKLRP